MGSGVVVLVDFENVQAIDFARLRPAARLAVFAGEGQRKVPIEVAMGLQAMGERARWVKASGAGPNALDFHIAFELGRMVQAGERGPVVVLSKDKGFDPSSPGSRPRRESGRAARPRLRAPSLPRGRRSPSTAGPPRRSTRLQAARRGTGQARQRRPRFRPSRAPPPWPLRPLPPHPRARRSARSSRRRPMAPRASGRVRPPPRPRAQQLPRPSRAPPGRSKSARPQPRGRRRPSPNPSPPPRRPPAPSRMPRRRRKSSGGRPRSPVPAGGPPWPPTSSRCFARASCATPRSRRSSPG
ncbi:PIN domain-containing protein [Cupriavidus basilensis]